MTDIEKINILVKEG